MEPGAGQASCLSLSYVSSLPLVFRRPAAQPAPIAPQDPLLLVPLCAAQRVESSASRRAQLRASAFSPQDIVATIRASYSKKKLFLSLVDFQYVFWLGGRGWTLQACLDPVMSNMVLGPRWGGGGSVTGSFETLGVSSRREETSLVSVSEGRSISVERGPGLFHAKAGLLEGKQRERVLKGRGLGHKRGAQRKENCCGSSPKQD